MFVCSLCTPRSFDGSSPNLVGVCRLTSHLPLRGSFSKRSTGHFRFPLYYICASLMPHAAKGSFCFPGSAAESNSAPFAALHINGICRWTSQLLLRGSFSKRSMGRRVNGSTGQMGQRVTFTFTMLYIIADDARLTPPCCKNHTGSTGRRVNGSMGQRVKWVDVSTAYFHFHYIIYDSRRRQAHATPLQKAHGVG